MTDNQGTQPEAAIIEQIIGDAEAQAGKLIENARLSVTAEEKKTERELAKFEEDVRSGWEARVEKIRMREVSTARIESRRILLNAREEAVVRVFGDIKAGLGHLREDPGRYRESLRSLAVEAVAAVGGEEAVLRVSERDRGFADDAFIEDVRGRVNTLAAGTGFRVEFDSGDNGGGCIATSADGRIVFDDTYGRRLDRLRPEIRAMIVGELDRDNG
jgi:V/A-type H+-transporting ATPase subunit E